MNLSFLKFAFLLAAMSLFACQNKENTLQAPPQKAQEYAIAIHGGAGGISPGSIPEDQRSAYEDKLNEALDAAENIVKNDGAAVDAVVAAITILEDCPLFNAGKGAVFTNDGKNELDASIMTGHDRNAGAVAGISQVKNPILAARLVMDQSPHVMLAGTGAINFAREHGLELVDSSYFFTQTRWDGLQRVLKRDLLDKHGTVGCVVLDKHGNLAAGTSTGGMTNKKYGRIGDSPIIGAGTYAQNSTCAVSATGHGEFFIRYAVAHSVSALYEHKNMSLQEAADSLINGTLKNLSVNGGLIAVDHLGNIAMPFNTSGMFRAYLQADGSRGVAMFAD